MGNQVFPGNLPGLKFNDTFTPVLSTLIKRSTSGREYRASLFPYPLYRFSRSYELLRNGGNWTEFKTLVGFYLSRYGAWDSFLFEASFDCNANNQVIGTGNGSGKNFQMVRDFGGWIDPVMNVNSTPTPIVKVNGVNNAAWTFNYLDSGVLTFTGAAPANGATISVTANYYHRVRFEEFTEGSDAFAQFMYNLFEAKKISFITAR